MMIKKINEFTRGWIVGDFDPSIIKTKDFEFAVQYYSRGDKEQGHTHKISDEISVIVYGHFRINDNALSSGEVIWLKPGEEMTSFECLEEGAIAVIKRPSVIGDKYATSVQ
jgi:hypothetical protein